MDHYPELSQKLYEMYRLGIVISPWLYGIGAVRIDSALFEKVESEVHDYVLRQWTPAERQHVFGNRPANEKIVQHCIYEIVTSSAVYLAHEKTGALDVTERILAQAFTLVQFFVRKHGFSALVFLYFQVIGWENLQALAYYGEIPETEFLLGEWHRPWIDYSIWDELLYSCYLGLMQIIVRDGKRFVKLTAKGVRELAYKTDVLSQAGYFSWRLQTLRISQLSQFNDYPVSTAEIWPNFIDKRRHFLDWAGIQPGMKVLELGCGDGVFTYDGGLAEHIGPTGQLIAVDPAAGMIARANTRLKTHRYDWVEFRQGRAEELPFADRTFDAVIGVAFLHFTERFTALREMRRVVRPGGIVASYHPTKNSNLPPFLQEWFAALFDLAKKRNEPVKDYLPYEKEVLEAFQDSGLQDIVSESADLKTLYHDPIRVVRHFIEGVGWFGEELSLLPWKARVDLIESLKQIGREVCQKYSPDERVIYFPNQMVKGNAPLA